MTRFGIILECDDNFEAALRQAEYAETLGYDSLYIAEHHNASGYVPNPFTALAAIAARTERVRIGSFIAVLPLYHPVQLAEQAAIVDRISNGRLVLGLGLGYVPAEFSAVGVPYQQRVKRVEEGIPLLRRLFTEDVVEHHSDAFDFSDAAIFPKPVQQPMMPIWLGGWVEPAIRRAARLADLWVPGLPAHLDAVNECFDIFRDELRLQGKPTDIEFVVGRELFCGRDADDARERGGRHIHQFYKDTYLQWPHPRIQDYEREQSYEEFVYRRFVVGGPQECIDIVEEFRKTGVEEFIFRMQHPGVSDADARDSMERFAKEVIPHFR